MIRYITRRLFLFAVVLFVVHAATFLLTTYLALRGPISQGYVPDTQVSLEAVFSAYPAYLQGLFNSPQAADGTPLPLAQRPAVESVFQGLPKSLILLGIALTFSVVVGISVGFLSVDHQTRRTNLFAILASLAGFSMPGFYIGIVVFFIMLQAAASRGQSAFVLPVLGYGLDEHLILPVISLAARPTAEIARLTAELLAEELPKNYVRTARAKGLPWRLVIIRHAARNVAGAVITALGNSWSYLIGTLVIIETVFDWGGIGQRLLKSVTFSDYIGSRFDPVMVAGLAVALALLFLLADLFTELAAQTLDPRLRRAHQGGLA